MSTRVVHVEYERIGRWVTNFARRHGGAIILPDAEGANLAMPDGEGSPSGSAADNADMPLPDGEDSPSGSGVDGANMPPRGQADVLRIRGVDGEIADLHRWSHAHPREAALMPAPEAGDVTEPQHLEAIASWCAPPTHLGLVLIRRGGYAVGRAQGPALASHKTGTRYVQSRTAAGGWSQQRFARRRGNQAEALVATVVDLAAHHLLPPPAGSAPHLPEAMVLGGDRVLAEQVLGHPELGELARLPRRVFADLPEPRFAVLETALQRGRSVPVHITPGR